MALSHSDRHGQQLWTCARPGDPLSVRARDRCNCRRPLPVQRRHEALSQAMRRTAPVDAMSRPTVRAAAGRSRTSDGDERR